jgi:uncharacterized protein
VTDRPEESMSESTTVAPDTPSEPAPVADGPPAPVPASERLAILDILRGFALFGILTINIIVFKAPWGLLGLGYEGPLADRLVLRAIVLLVESKFFTLFSFLFGLGFAIQLLRARGAGARFGLRYARRLSALLLFGVAHVVLLWDGDILIIYALVGVLLLLFRNASSRALLVWACVLLLVPLALWTTAFIGVEAGRRVPEVASRIREADASIPAAVAGERASVARLFAEGSYAELLAWRVTHYRGSFLFMLTRVPTVLAMFLLGLYVGKEGMLWDVEGHLSLLRRVRVWGLGLGLFASALVTVGFTSLPPVSAMIALAFDQALAGPILCLGYAAAVTLLARSPAWQLRLHPLGMTGRMALTNYLMQSLICSLIFNGYGLGLVGKVAPTGAILLAVGIFGVQMVLSSWWLGRFRFGPMEWLWRLLTYGRWPTMSRATPV